MRSAASFLSAAARVDCAPAHLSVQSAFPSLAHRPYSLLSWPHCIPSLGDRAKADYSSMQVRIPAEFWGELKERKLIEQDAPVPA